MSGGAKFEYLWQDGTKYKKPTHLPAPQYISLLMDWVESQINDENVRETWDLADTLIQGATTTHHPTHNSNF